MCLHLVVALLVARDAMDAAALSEALAAASLSEYAAPLAERIGDLSRARGDKRVVLDVLKAAGVSKMGTRQRIATICLMLECAAPEPEPKGGAEWADVFGQSAAILAMDGDLPPPSSAAADEALAAAPRMPSAEVAVAPPPPPPPEPLAQPAAPAAAPAPTGGVVEAGAGPSAAATPPTVAASASAASSSATASAARASSELYRKLGDEAFGRKDVAAAERWYEQSLGADPSHAALHGKLADCAAAASPADPARALRHLRALLASPPPHGEAWLRAGRLALALGELDAATQYFDAALAEEEGRRTAAGQQESEVPRRTAPHHHTRSGPPGRWPRSRTGTSPEPRRLLPPPSPPPPFSPPLLAGVGARRLGPLGGRVHPRAGGARA